MTTADLNAFRDEIRTWLEANAPAGVRNLPPGGDSMCWGGKKWTYVSEDQRLWVERAAARGLTVPEWPREYGGAGLSKDEAKIFNQELQRQNIRKPLEGMGIWMLGPALLKYGTEEQKTTHLPGIAQGKVRWCQGYSEPGAGSDLASLSTRCTDEGDHWLVNGSKIWTSYGDKSDWIFALVRTNTEVPKQQGISFLLIDMATPGVTTQPIRLIAGSSPFTATFFDDVTVPKENMVGQPGHGWEIAKYLLQHERESMGSMQTSKAGDEPMSRRAIALLGREGLADAGMLRAEIANYEIDAWKLAIYVERVRDLAKARQALPTSASVLKLVATELTRTQAEIMMSLTGADGLQWGSDPSFDWLHAPIGPIAGGSNEIQLNIVAKRALDLPEA
jgi:acyl-CoA dehydrogenase